MISLRKPFCLFGPLLIIGSLCSVCLSKAWAVLPPPAYSKMIAKFKALTSYQVTIDESTLLQPLAPGARSRTITSSDAVIYKSPNSFSLINNGLMGGVTVVSDGQTEYIYSSLTQEYATRKAPTDVLSNFTGSFHGGSVTWNSVKTATVNGLKVTEIDGSVNSSRGVVRITLDIKKADSLPLRIVMGLPTVSASTGDGLSVTRTETFTDQKVNGLVSNQAFKFSPPDGATKVDSLNDLGGGFGSGGLG